MYWTTLGVGIHPHYSPIIGLFIDFSYDIHQIIGLTVLLGLDEVIMLQIRDDVCRFTTINIGGFGSQEKNLLIDVQSKRPTCLQERRTIERGSAKEIKMMIPLCVTFFK